MNRYETDYYNLGYYSKRIGGDRQALPFFYPYAVPFMEHVDDKLADALTYNLAVLCSYLETRGVDYQKNQKP